MRSRCCSARTRGAGRGVRRAGTAAGDCRPSFRSACRRRSRGGGPTSATPRPPCMPRPPRSACPSPRCSRRGARRHAGLRNLGTRYLFDWQSHFYKFGPSVSVPIFHGRRACRNVRSVAGPSGRGGARYRQTVLDALQEVEDGLSNLTQDAARVGSLKETVGADQRAVDVQFDAYRHGVISYIRPAHGPGAGRAGASAIGAGRIDREHRPRRSCTRRSAAAGGRRPRVVSPPTRPVRYRSGALDGRTKRSRMTCSTLAVGPAVPRAGRRRRRLPARRRDGCMRPRRPRSLPSRRRSRCQLPGSCGPPPGERPAACCARGRDAARVIRAQRCADGVDLGRAGPCRHRDRGLATAVMVRRPHTRLCAVSNVASGRRAGWGSGAIGIVVVAVALRLIYGGRVELMPEETYYWNYSRHLDIGYLDHPPMVAWLIAAGTRVFGDCRVRRARPARLCIGGLATFFVHRLTRNLFGRPSALVAVVLMQTLPFFFLTGLLITPDAPLMAAWAASLYFLERALVAGRRRAWWGAGLGHRPRPALEVHHRARRACPPSSSRSSTRERDDGCAARSRMAPPSLALAVFSPVHLVERPQRLGILSLPNLASPGGPAAVRAAQAPRLGRRPADADRDCRRRAGALPPSPRPSPRRVTRRVIAAGDSCGWPRSRRWRCSSCSVCGTKSSWIGPARRCSPSCPCWPRDRARCRGRRCRPPWLPWRLLGSDTRRAAAGVRAGSVRSDLGHTRRRLWRHAELVPVGWRQLGPGRSRPRPALEQETGHAPLVVGMDRYAIASELAFYAPIGPPGSAAPRAGIYSARSG